MTEKMRILLPFAVPASNRTEPFMTEEEKAAIFCLAELERGKGGRILGRQPAERIEYVAKACYPFWLFPFHGTYLVFDGVGMVSHTLTYPSMPDVETFAEGVERSSTSQEAYMSFLSANVNYFKVSGTDEKIGMRGLVSDPAFLQDFSLYFSEGKPLESLPQDMVTMTPALSEESLSDEIQQLEELEGQLAFEVKNLKKSIRLLSLTTKNFVHAINIEIKEVKNKYAAELEKLRGPAEREIAEIRRKGDADITAVSRKFEKELFRLQKEKIKVEKTKEHLSSKIDRSEVEIKNSSAKKDEAGKKRWKEEKNRLKKLRSEAESEIKKLEGEIEATEERKSQELFKIRAETEAKTQEARKELTETEAARDAEIHVLKNKSKKMEELTSEIIKQMDQIVRIRENLINGLSNLGIPLERDTVFLAYMPFYLACFRFESRKRYVPYPPSIVNSVKLATKLKGALGIARIKQLFSPRSAAITSLLSRLPNVLEENAALGNEISEAAVKLDIVQVKDGKQGIKKGMDRLKEEGWLSEKEYSLFSQRLA
ncbi:hypothetical protein KEJ15_00545 [Candidatus Bathyarchaeota archaeon]|nr:hypothetical protein [Candidatus Bathyarchaeota archaeon]